jgi:hypothetical protein
MTWSVMSNERSRHDFKSSDSLELESILTSISQKEYIDDSVLTFYGMARQDKTRQDKTRQEGNVARA